MDEQRRYASRFAETIMAARKLNETGRFSVKRGLASESKGNGLSGHFTQAGAKTGAIPQQFETPRLATSKADSPGFLLLDNRLQPLYLNDEAVSILCYPRSPHGNGDVANFPKQRIDSMLAKRKDAPDPTFSSEFTSGRRHYQVQVFALKCNLENHAGRTLAILLERKREHPDLLRVARKFHLTEREKEALELLMQGCTTKQIASRMDISPNTAKAFLRSVMFKTGAFNRAGILAKILQL